MLATPTYALILLIGVIIVCSLVIRLPIVRMSFIPASLMAGLVLLVLGPQIAGMYFVDWQIPTPYYQFWSKLPALLINVVFACLFLARPILPFRKMWRLAGPQVAFGQTLAWGQYMVGGLLALFVLVPVLGLNPLSGALIEISFEGGHGTVAGLSSVFHQLQFSEGRELAMGLATVSLASAIICGLVLVHWGVRKHHIKTLHKQSAVKRAYHRRILYELRKQDLRLRDHLTCTNVVSHILLVLVALFFGWLIHATLIYLENTIWAARLGITIFRYLPLFTLCMFGGIIAHNIWKKLKLPISRPLVEVISGASLGLLIASAVGTMSLTFIKTHPTAFVLLAVSGIVWILFGFLVFAPRMFRYNWFQNGIVNMGQSMGMTATGLLFLHMVDPEDKTSSMESFGYKQLLFEPLMGGGIVTALSMPLILAWGLIPFTIVCSVICIAWLVFGLFFFRKNQIYVK